MTTQKTITQVFETKDYNKFKFLGPNRVIKRPHIEKLKKSMARKYLLNPIMVNKRMEIMDGQHRYTAAQELNLPIRYYISTNLDIEDIAPMNNLTQSWKLGDYLHAYKTKGLVDYNSFELFIQKYPKIPHTTALQLLAGATTRNRLLEENFIIGKFKLKCWNGAIHIADFFEKIAAIYPGTYRRTFLSAMLIVMKHPEFTEERFLRKLDKKHLLLRDFSRERDYITVIEELYNWMETKKVRFF